MFIKSYGIYLVLKVVSLLTFGIILATALILIIGTLAQDTTQTL